MNRQQRNDTFSTNDSRNWCRGPDVGLISGRECASPCFLSVPLRRTNSAGGLLWRSPFDRRFLPNGLGKQICGRIQSSDRLMRDQKVTDASTLKYSLFGNYRKVRFRASCGHWSNRIFRTHLLIPNVCFRLEAAVQLFEKLSPRSADIGHFRTFG